MLTLSHMVLTPLSRCIGVTLEVQRKFFEPSPTHMQRRPKIGADWFY